MVVDGVMYRVLECDEITMFADRGVYLGVNDGPFYNAEAFVVNVPTGELSANPDYIGASAVFDLPLDKALANPEKAKQYLETIWADDGYDTLDVINGD